MCSLDEAIRDRVAEPATSCGDVDFTAELSVYVAAHDCAALALQNETSFVVRWGTALIDYGDGRHAFVGIATDAGYGVMRFGAGADERNATYSFVQTCSRVVDLGACDDVDISLCLQCSDPAEPVCP